MKLDTFTFSRPSFYKKKARFMYQLKKTVYGLQRKDLDGDWRFYLRGRDVLLKRHCSQKKVLDVGCGTGDFLDELRRDHQARELVGLDISEEMISEAKRGHSENSYFVGSCDRLPFSDKSFDVVTFQWVFHHLALETAIDTLKEARRVCRESIIIQDTLRHDAGLMRHLSLLYWKMVDGGICYRTKPEWREFFSAHGLKLEGEHQGEIIRTGIFVLRPAA